MIRLKITADDALRQAPEEAAARQGGAVGETIEQGWVMPVTRPVVSARGLVARARQRAWLEEPAATDLALDGALHHVARRGGAHCDGLQGRVDTRGGWG